MIENLQILTCAENVKKSAKGRTVITLNCDNCGKQFEREIRQFKKNEFKLFL